MFPKLSVLFILFLFLVLPCLQTFFMVHHCFSFHCTSSQSSAYPDHQRPIFSPIWLIQSRTWSWHMWTWCSFRGLIWLQFMIWCPLVTQMLQQWSNIFMKRRPKVVKAGVLIRPQRVLQENKSWDSGYKGQTKKPKQIKMGLFLQSCASMELEVAFLEVPSALGNNIES